MYKQSYLKPYVHARRIVKKAIPHARTIASTFIPPMIEDVIVHHKVDVHVPLDTSFTLIIQEVLKILFIH
jgi:hypothetical protein